MKRNIMLRYIAPGLMAIGICIATGCATKDTVSSRFPKLQENINAAKAAEAEVYAPAPLKSAETKLEAAKAAVAAMDMVSANKLVDEAMADADYALALANTEKAKHDAMKLREAIQTVREEIENMPAVK
ncbi:MAG: DUF4398 domain-containing protein [Deltaproteobacteria bacterium]|nr:DUF4398 domain-containing protein [Deltaproteobacteria bacterium]